jgi:hypothetical protein
MTTIAERVRAIAKAAPARSPERRAAAALHTALITTKTPEAALRALQTFTDPETRAAAVALYGQLGQTEREAALCTIGNGSGAGAAQWRSWSCSRWADTSRWPGGRQSARGRTRPW